MQILIGGEDEVAFRLADMLMTEHGVVVVCPEDAIGPRAERLDVEIQPGRCTSTDVLRRAHAGDADIFIACTPSDEQNLVACVAAKKLGAERTVCFLFRPELQSAIDDDETLSEAFEIDTVIRPTKLLAEEFQRIVTVPGALDAEAFVGGRVRLLRHAIEEGAPIANKPLRDLGIPQGVVLVMARRGEQIFIPAGDTVFQPGDKVTAMGKLGAMNRLMYRYLRGEHARESRRVTVVGGGAVGLRVAQGLEESGWEVKVIEANRARAEEIAPLLKKAIVLHGDGADLDLLEQERVGDDSVLVAVTSNDEKNLLVSLLAKNLGVSRILTRATFESNERLFEKVGIDVVRSARGTAIQELVRTVIQGRSELLAELEHGEAVVIDVEAPAGMSPVPLMNIRGPSTAIIGAILRGRKVTVPHGGDSIQGGDRLLVFCMRQDEEAVQSFYGRRIAKEATA